MTKAGGAWLAGLAGVVIAGVAAASPGGASGAACGRACLLQAVDGYLAALAEHDATRLSAAGPVRFTENGVALPMGSALWRTVSRVEPPLATFADAEHETGAVVAGVEEAGRPALLTAWLKIDHGRVVALDTLVARKENSSYLNPPGWRTPRPALAAALPASERSPGPTMTKAADAYLAGLTGGRELPSFAADCNRVENGVQTTNVAAPLPGQAAAALNSPTARLGCEAQFRAHTLKFVSRVRDTRYVAVDQASGLALAVTVFDHDGVDRPAPGAPRLASSLPSPYSFLVGELFKLRGGRIAEIDAVITSAPYGYEPAWSRAR